MSEYKIPIPSMIYNASVGGHVTNSQQIIDENENKEQSQINAEVKQTLGQGGSVDNRINQAKNDIIGGASSACDTLGKTEALISAEKIRAQTAEADRYTKSETYTKEEVNGMITTPNQEYVSVEATEQTTAATDVLPATGAADTIYRVANWDGSQYDASVYSEYTWNTSTSSYIKLSTKNVGIDDEPTAGSEKLVKSGGIVDVYGKYENNFEFVEAHKDKDGRFLYGVDKKNDFIFGCGIPFAIKRKCNYITVDKQGKGDYGTLTGAVANAKDGDTIIVMPGIYENESAKAGDKKTLYIIGVDREKCIIKNSSGDYYNPPIQFSGGLIRNITVIAESTTGDSYCVHMDYHNEKNNTIDIENCTFINKAKLGALGIGLRGGCVLTIKNCLVSAPNGGRALLCHDNDYNDAQYEGLQTLKVYDSVLYCPDAAVFIQGQGNVSRDFSVSQYYIEFVRNRVKGNVAFINWYEQPQLGEITQDDYQGIKNLRLSNISWGNSASILNNE